MHRREEGGLPRERRGEVEAEAVDVALGHPVAQRVRDHPQHAGVGEVQRVPGSRVVAVPAAIGLEVVVRGIVQAAEGEHRAAVVTLRGVVVDDVEDHLDPGPVERLDHSLELAHLLPAHTGGGVLGVGREEADRRVAPVVREPAVVQEALVGDLVDREQLDRRDAERDEVLDRGVRGEPGIGAAQILADVADAAS